MAADQQFCLRWNNHQSTLVSVFDSLLEKETLVDCTLAAEGQYLKAHKVVLCACSPYLETLLSQHYEKHPIVILKDVKFTELKSMMDYMYRGEVNISQDQLGTFLKAAESLQIKGLSENGEGDARDVGSTTKPPPRKPPATPAAQPELAQSPAHRSRDGSVSPSSRKRRRLRRNSDDGDNHLDSNSCDLPVQAQSTPVVPNIPASITTTPIRTPIVKPEVNDRLDHNSLPPESGLLKEKIEPAEPLLEPKTEYLEDLNNDDSVEDLTLDDDDEMDMSQMSNMSNMSRPGPSHGADISNQGFTPWQLGNQSGTDEVFMAAQEAVNAHRDSQDTEGSTLRILTVNTINEALGPIESTSETLVEVKEEEDATGSLREAPVGDDMLPNKELNGPSCHFSIKEEICEDPIVYGNVSEEDLFRRGLPTSEYYRNRIKREVEEEHSTDFYDKLKAKKQRLQEYLRDEAPKQQKRKTKIYKQAEEELRYTSLLIEECQKSQSGNESNAMEKIRKKRCRRSRRTKEEMLTTISKEGRPSTMTDEDGPSTTIKEEVPFKIKKETDYVQ